MTISMIRPNIGIVLSAPSGGGKTSICRALLERDPDLAYSLSTTSRPPRAHERTGRDYDFVSREAFERMIADGVFLEHAEVHGHLYGTRRDLFEERLASGRDVVLDIDVQGALNLRKASGKAVLIFVLPPSLAVLEERLRGRGSDTEETIRRRLKNASAEIAEAWVFDYLVMNEDLDETIDAIRAIITAERQRASRQRIVCEGEGDLDQRYPRELPV